ncbi:DUF1192 domain-containing protein [Mesorhizobium sp. ASY16-5R]|uniref:DUF1192 domain-containing protein n=1 Tax=Mesorhizobium sp. ASY16-5R TaxID=3445772 RepID=UPI003F9F3C77
MAIFDDEPRKPASAHVVGQDISLMSADELVQRIALLKAEIERLEEERAKRGATKSAAEVFFRR